VSATLATRRYNKRHFRISAAQRQDSDIALFRQATGDVISLRKSQAAVSHGRWSFNSDRGWEAGASREISRGLNAVALKRRFKSIAIDGVSRNARIQATTLRRIIQNHHGSIERRSRAFDLVDSVDLVAEIGIRDERFGGRISPMNKSNDPNGGYVSSGAVAGKKV